MKNTPLPPPSDPSDWEQEMARLVGFQEESTSNGKADYQPENSEPSLAEAEEPDQVHTEQPMWSNPFAKAGMVGATTLVGVSVAGLFLSTVMGGQKQAPTNTNNVVTSQALRSQATSESREQPLEKEIEDLKTKLALSRQEEEVIQAQQKLKNSPPTPERVVQPTITPQPQPREAITRTSELRNPAPIPTRIGQVVRPTITPQPQVPNTRTPQPQISSGYYYPPPNTIPVVRRSTEPQSPISRSPSSIYLPQIASSSLTSRPPISTTTNVPRQPPPPVIIPPAATTPQPKPNAAELWATLAKLGSYGQVSATARPNTPPPTTASRPNTPPPTTASRQSTPPPTTASRQSTPPPTTTSRQSTPPPTTPRTSTQASAPASNIQEFSARPNPQTSTTPRPNPQTSTTPRPNPQTSTTPRPNPQTSTTPRPNPQASTTPSLNPQVSTTPSPNPQAFTTPRPNPQTSTTPSPNPQVSTTPSPNPQVSTTPSPNPNVSNSDSTNNRSVTPANPVVSQASQSLNKTLVLGSRAKGTLATAIYGEQSTSSTNNKNISVVRLTEPLKALDGAIALPVGTEIVSQINSISTSGLVQLSVIKIVLNKNGKLTETNVPSGAITILGNKGKPLIASKLQDDVISTNSRSFIVGGIRGISKVIGQLNTNQKKPTTKKPTPDPNVFTEVLEGGTTEVVSKLTTSQAGRTPTQTNIWVLESGTKVEIFVNQSIQL